MNVFNSFHSNIFRNRVVTAPNAPTSLASSSKTQYSVTISFTKPSGTVTYYTATAVNGSNTYTSYSTSSPITISGLSGSTTYTVSIKATNSKGTSSSSGSVSATTNSEFTLNTDSTLSIYYDFESSNISVKSLKNVATGKYDASLATLSGSTLPVVNTTTYKVGNSSLYFSGGTASAGAPYINLATPFYIPTNGFSFSFWYYTTSTTTSPWIIAFGNGLKVFQGTTQLNVVTDGETADSYQAGVVTNMVINTWYHIAITCSKLINFTTRPTVKCYSNNSLTYSSNGTLYYPQTACYTNTFIGRNSSTGDTGVTGYLDDFRMYDKELSASEVSSLYSYKIISSPTINTATFITSSTAYIGFTAPSGLSSQATYDASAGGVIYGATGYSNNSIYVSGLTSNTKYSFAVRAIDTSGASSYSSTTDVYTLPSAPSAVTSSAITSSSITLAITTSGGGAYTETYKVNGSNEYSASGVTNPTISSLSANTSYTFTVYAIANDVTSTTYTTSSFKTLPSAPSSVTSSAITSSSITLAITTSGGGAYTETYNVSGSNGYTGSLVSSSPTISGLYSNTSYTFTVYAVANSVNSTSATTFTTNTLSDSPTSLYLSSYTTSSLTIGFTAPSGKISYYTATATDGSNNSYTSTITIGTSVTITGLSSNTSYTVTITATNSSLTSSNSTSFVAMTSPIAATYLTSYSTNTTSATISFTESTDTVSYYTATATYGSNTYTSYSTTTPITISGLSSSTTYTVTIIATNSYGTSSSSTSVDVTTTSPISGTVLSSPTGLYTSSISSSSAYIVFIQPDNADSDTTYDAAAGGLIYGATSYSNTSIYVRGISANVLYSFAVRTINNNGASSYSSTVDVYTLPSAPLSVTSSAITSSSITLAITTSGGGAYTETYNVSGSNGYSGSLVSSYPTISSLSANTSYTFTVYAVANGVTSTTYTSSSFKTLPSAPSSVTSSAITTSSITLAITTSGGGAYTETYNVSGSNGYSGSLVSSSPNVTGLSSNTSYTFTVYAVANSVNSTSATTFTTNTLPDSPTSLYLSSYTTSSLTVGFTAPSGTISFYTATAKDGSNNSYTGTSTTTTVTISGLSSNTSYTVTITATNSSYGTSSNSSSLSAMTNPNIVTSLSSFSTNTNSVTVSFTQPSGTVSYYTATVTYGSSTYTSYSTNSPITISGLSVSTTYTVNITATNSYGTTSSASSVSATTSAYSFSLNTDASLAYYYDFELSSISGTSLKNLATGTYDASCVYSPTISTTIYKVGSRSIYFAGGAYAAAPYVQLPFNVYFGSVGFTISFWFYLGTTSYSNTRILTLETGIAIYAGGSEPGTYTISLRVINATNSNTYTALTNLSSSTWYHFSWTVSSSSIWTFYLNGSVSSTRTSGGTYPYLCTTSYNYIGKSNSSNEGRYIGYVDDFRIYKRVLSASEVSSLYSYTGTSSSSSNTSVPTIGSASSITSSSAYIGFTAPSGAASGTTYDASAGGVIYGATSYSNTTIYVRGLSGNTLYLFSVRAINSSGASSYSSTVNVYTLPTAPSAVTSSLTTSSTTSLTMTRGTSGTAYTEYYNTTSSPSAYTGSSEPSPVLVNGLTANTSYTFTVYSVTTAGTSTTYTTASIVTSPAAPSAVTSSATTSSSLTLSITTSGGGGYTETYTVKSSDNSTTYATSSSSPTISSLYSNTSYTFNVYAVANSVTSTTYKTASLATLPDAPSTVTTSFTSTTVTLTVTSGSAGSANTETYTVKSSDNSTTYATSSSSPVSPSVTLLSNTSYMYNVYAVTSIGTSTTYTTVSIVTLPGPPSAVTSSATTSSSLTLAITTSGGGAYPETYNVISTVYTSNGVSSSPPTITGLSSNTLYTFTVYAVANGVTSTTYTSSELATLPEAPSTVTSSFTSTSATITPTSGSSGSANTETYSVYDSTGGLYTTSSSPLSITGLTGNTSYTLNVYAVTSVGTSTTYRSLEITTLPAPPSTVTSSLTTSSSITLQITTSGGGLYLETYNVTGSNGYSATGLSSTPTITGLSSNTLYTFTVYAVANGVTSTTYTSSALATLPEAPSTVTSSDITNSSVTLTLTSGSSGSANTETYSVYDSTGGLYTTSSSPLSLTGLIGDTSYTLNVYTVTSVGTSTTYTSVTITTLPTTITSSNITSTGVTLTMIKSGGGENTEIYTVKSSNNSITYATSASSPVSITGLTAGTSYTLNVYVVVNGATSQTYTQISIVTLLAAPTNLSSSTNTNSVTISFDAPSGTATYYTATAFDGTNTYTSYSTSSPNTVSGLSTSTTYTVTITATNSYGTSTSSGSVTAITVEPAILSIPTTFTSNTLTNSDGTYTVSSSSYTEYDPYIVFTNSTSSYWKNATIDFTTFATDSTFSSYSLGFFLDGTDICISGNGKYAIFTRRTHQTIYVSSDYGATYSSSTAIGSGSGNKNSMVGLAMSYDGTYRLALTDFGNYDPSKLYKSSNGGSSWTSVFSTDNTVRGAYSRSVAISYDGKYQICSNSMPGYPYLSSDYGSSWNAVINLLSSITWWGVAISYTGQYMSITMNTGVYVSSDYGSNWNKTLTISSAYLCFIAMSSSGQYQTAVVVSSTKVYVSSNYGSSWTTKTMSYSGIYSLAMTDSGKYQFVTNSSYADAVHNAYSSDYGVTWTIGGSLSLGGNTETACSMSYDGKYTLVMVGAYGAILRKVLSDSAGYNSSGIYTGSYSTTVSSIARSGEWLQIQVPSSVSIKSYNLYNSNVSLTYAKVFYLAGSNDGTTWVLVDSQSLSTTPAISSTYTTSNIINYTYYRIIFNTLDGTSPTYIYLNQLNLYIYVFSPTIGIASSITSSSAYIEFTAPSDAAIGTTYDAAAGGVIYGATSYPNTTIYVRLSSNTSYSFAVRTINTKGTSSYSSTITFTTLS